MDESQMLKGILEGCILAIIAKGETYGYDILNVLEESGLDDIGEGTLYPILTRLEKKEYIVCRIGKSPFGPKRKYFSITELGKEQLTTWKIHYKKVISSAEQIIWRDEA
jgi:PadR family transcriptional regulator, regulatory protein PadR